MNISKEYPVSLRVSVTLLMHGLGLHRVKWHKYVVAYERTECGRMRSWFIRSISEICLKKLGKGAENLREATQSECKDLLSEPSV